MKNKVMKAVLNVLEGLAMGILVATIVTAVGFVTMYPLAYLMGAV
jgi:predicted RND superfamily exporter protein